VDAINWREMEGQAPVTEHKHVKGKESQLLKTLSTVFSLRINTHVYPQSPPPAPKALDEL
jgi:hypothetical protein